jgi:glycosyltransferase involved in cell wall biosynthesis
MASGMACVSNVNPHTAWFLRDGENCLLAPPAPTQVAERLAALVEDPELRRRLAERAIEDVTAVAWDDQIERVWGAMTKRGEPFSDAPETPTALPRSAAPRG